MQASLVSAGVGCQRGTTNFEYNGRAGSEVWTIITYMQAGAYAAIMFAVVGVPQLLSSYFDHRVRRADRLENEANAERRHQENLQAEARRETRQEEREERQEERRREERRLEEEREERRREERRLEEERRRQDAEEAERRHREMMALLIAALNNRGNQDNGESELIRSLQQTIETLESENARLRRENGDGNPSQSP